MRSPSITGDAALCQRIILPPSSWQRSFFQISLPLLASRQNSASWADSTYTRSPSIVGVERGPSPPLFSFAPLSPPPSYLAEPSGTDQTCLPVLASSATHTSSPPPSTNVQALPPPTEKQLNPPGVGAFQTTRGAVHVARIFSVQMPSWFAPRYCSQSPPKASVAPARTRRPKLFPRVALTEEIDFMA